MYVYSQSIDNFKKKKVVDNQISKSVQERSAFPLMHRNEQTHVSENE